MDLCGISRNRKIALALLTLGAIIITAALLYNLSQHKEEPGPKLDLEAPEIKSIEYKEKLGKGEYQKISILVNEKNPSDFAILNLNKTSIELPLVKDYGNGTVVYEKGFDPSSISNEEGKLIGYVIVSDKFGNKIEKEISFYSNLEAPEIKSIEYKEKLGKGEYQKISILVNEKNPSDFAILNLNKTSIELPLVKDYGNGTVVYEKGFDPSSISNEEGK
ncbi:MAG: hypothetical protein QW521_05805, partial [Desulfurococcaceae archaeon]